MKFHRRSDDLAELLTATAEEHVGYRHVAGPNPYRERVGYNGHDAPWDGAFIDCVQRDAGLTGIPALVSTTAGLGEFLACRRVVSTPARGDVVFFSFPVTGHFAGPHVGLVADGHQFLKTGEFLVIEAQSTPGTPKGHAGADGIYVRRRHAHDVLAFCRPELKRRLGSAAVQTGSQITIVKLQQRRKTKDTAIVQKALNLVFVTPGPGRPFRADGPPPIDVTGAWDEATRSAFARYQRSIGFAGPDASGLPEPHALERLGRDTGTFSLTEVTGQ